MPSTTSTRAWPGRPPSRLLASQRGPRRLRRERDRGTPGCRAPESEELWQRECPLDTADGRRGELRGRHNPKKGHGRNHPGEFVAPRGALAEGQTLSGELRSGVREKKGDRDRLIRLARSHPEWALGFEDERWFSRFERPHLHSWAEKRASRCASCRKSPRRTIPSRRPAPATASICRSL